METRAYRIKLKAGSTERVQAWAQEVARRQEEALTTLRERGIVAECCFLEHAVDGDHLIVVVTAQHFGTARAAVEAAAHSLVAYTRQFREDTWESGGRLTALVDLNVMDELPQATTDRT